MTKFKTRREEIPWIDIVRTRCEGHNHMVLHDNGRYTDSAEAVLRNAAGLEL